jgi:hypothetical protein
MMSAIFSLFKHLQEDQFAVEFLEYSDLSCSIFETKYYANSSQYRPILIEGI